MYNAIKYPIGFAALFAAIYFFCKTMKNSSDVKACDGRKVDATIVNYDVQSFGNGLVFYYLVYEYEIDGEIHKHTSTTPLIKPVSLGKTVRLNYDAVNRAIVDQTNIVAGATSALACGVIALIVLSV